MNQTDQQNTPDDMPLSAWYAAPMSEPEARRLLERSHADEQAALLGSRPALSPRINRLIARYWLGKNIEHDFCSLRAIFPREYDQALLHLVYGQLLVSCKRAGAMEYLRTGFVHAVPYLSSSEYFEVMKRHQHLASLTLVDSGQPGLPLESLIQEARVIERLTGKAGAGKKADHKDTIG